MLLLITEAVKNGARLEKACESIGLSSRTIYRWRKKPYDERIIVKRIPANKYRQDVRDRIVEICCSKRFVDHSPNTIVPILAEEGIYIASESTMYRVLKEKGLLHHRENSQPGQKKVRPTEKRATGPNQVFSWDITYLKTKIKGVYFFLYLFIDVWSRAIVEWNIFESENSCNASQVLLDLSKKIDLAGVYIHQDNGGPMKGATFQATLRSLGVIPSFSRPRVSDDNPYSEALFKTLKYRAGYPKMFDTIGAAKEWMEQFVDWYNEEHRHSGIKYVTPMQRHRGEDKDILELRKQTYKKAKKNRPNLWGKRSIRDWSWEKIVKLNPEQSEEKKIK